LSRDTKRQLIILVFLFLFISAVNIAGAESWTPENSDDYGYSSCLDTTTWMAQSDSPRKGYSRMSANDRMSIGSELTAQEVQQLIRLHNKVRADVGVRPVVWSKKLAIYAQEWANNLASNDCSLRHRPRSGKWKQEYGENLFMGTTGYYGVADAVKSWESEKIYYHGQTLNPSNWHNSGHYTQLVWKDTKEIGCAMSACNGDSIVVCNYNPPGNVLGQKPY